MEIGECQVRWDQHQIGRASAEMGDELDHLAHKDPRSHDQCDLPRVTKRRFQERVDEDDVVEQRKVEERGNVDRINAPRLTTPDSSVGE